MLQMRSHVCMFYAYRGLCSVLPVLNIVILAFESHSWIAMVLGPKQARIPVIISGLQICMPVQCPICLSLVYMFPPRAPFHYLRL